MIKRKENQRKVISAAKVKKQLNVLAKKALQSAQKEKKPAAKKAPLKASLTLSSKSQPFPNFGRGFLFSA